jgi:hypothetical protein
MQEDLSTWGSTMFGNFKKWLENLWKELNQVRKRSVGKGPLDEERKVLYKEEIFGLSNELELIRYRLGIKIRLLSCSCC